MQDGAVRLGGAGDAEGEIEGVKLKALGVEQGVVVAPRAVQIAHLRARPEFPRLAEHAGQPVRLGLQGVAVVEPGAADIAVGHGFAIDGVARDARADQRQRRPGQVVQLPGRAFADHGREPAIPGGIAAPDHAAVAARGAPGEAPRLQQHHLAAPLGQAERRGQPGHAAADDADLGLRIAVQRRARPVLGDGPGVVAVDVTFGHHRLGPGRAGRIIRRAHYVSRGMGCAGTLYYAPDSDNCPADILC